MLSLKALASASIVRSLRHRNFRLFFVGQAVSLVGTWMQQIAMSWLVYRLTHSAPMLGLVSFAAHIPIFLVVPFTGVLADRWDRRRIVVATQALSMAQAFFIAALLWAGLENVPVLVAAALFLGLVNAFDIPARQSLLSEMVTDKEDLGNAIALHAAVFNGARLVGPVVAGLLIAWAGETWCFFLNGLSYAGVIAALVSMRVPERRRVPPAGNVVEGLREGLRYVLAHPVIALALALLAFVSLAGFPYVTLLPVFVRESLGGGAPELGLLMGSTGLGALLGGFAMASRKRLRVRFIAVAAAIFGASLAAFSHARTMGPALFLLFLVGVGMIMQMVTTNTLVQTLAEDDKRGRVMSLYAMSLIGMAPFGSLWMGFVAGRIGASLTMLLGGVLCIAAAALYGWNMNARLRKQTP